MSDRLPWFRCDPQRFGAALSLMMPNEALLFTVLTLRVMEKGCPVSETTGTLSRRTGLTHRQIDKALHSLLLQGYVKRSGTGELDVPDTHAEIDRLRSPAGQREQQGKIARDLPPEWSAIKSLVAARDGAACSYCGDTSGPFEIDHVVPYSKGGASTPENLCVACKPCNRSKGAKLVAEWLS